MNFTNVNPLVVDILHLLDEPLHQLDDVVHVLLHPGQHGVVDVLVDVVDDLPALVVGVVEEDLHLLWLLAPGSRRPCWRGTRTTRSYLPEIL